MNILKNNFTHIGFDEKTVSTVICKASLQASNINTFQSKPVPTLEILHYFTQGTTEPYFPIYLFSIGKEITSYILKHLNHVLIKFNRWNSISGLT